MSVPYLLAATIACCLNAAEQPGPAQSLELKRDWWSEPARAGRHTTLVAAFDEAGCLDADHARDETQSGGFGVVSTESGKFGKAARLAEKGGHLHFLGGSNVNPSRGTVRLFVRGDVWQDDTPRWLFEARAVDRIGVRHEKGKLSLVFGPKLRTSEAISQLDMPVGEVSTDEWHAVVASWDREAGRGWIALDGKGVTGEREFPSSFRPVLLFYVGGGVGGRLGGMNEPGLEFDELVVYDQPLPLLEAETTTLPDEDREWLPRAEQGARKCLNFLADLQRWGGWMTIHTYPTLVGSYAQGREYVDYDDAIGNDKSHATPYIAARFLYAYEVLHDYRFMDVALRTAEFLLAAQDGRGFWHYGYKMTVNGIKPNASDRHIKLQDSVQSHPLFFFAYLHRLTGDERYLDALKKAGEFYLAAQNPDGSWSHHWNAEKGIGENAIGQPQGGELNDLCTNDAIDVMLLMYHVTGEGKYVEAIRRCGEWLIGAQLKGATRGWADQYDGESNPAPARHFEPAACGPTATRLACRALVEVYRVTKDERYLRPLRDCLAWLEATFPDGMMWCYHDPKTGRPIASWQRKLYFLDDPKQLAFIKSQPTGVWYYQQTKITPTIKKILDGAAIPETPVPDVTAQAALDSLPGKREAAKGALETQNEDGVWVVPNVANFMGSVGAGFSTSSPRVLHLLRYIEAARIAAGELPPAWRGNGELLRMAYPAGDWYSVD